jgi:CubicO group peptidase (beta-lactamase class C family)
MQSVFSHTPQRSTLGPALLSARLPILLSSLVLLLTACAAPRRADTDTRIDEIVAAWNKPGTPGASIAVIEHGRLVFNKGYGIANLEYDIPITPDTVFHVASVSKQFTAMAVVLLEQEKKLSVDDDVKKYLPELPDYGATITIRNLLQHTGGIRDQWQTLALRRAWVRARACSNDTSVADQRRPYATYHALMRFRTVGSSATSA